MEYNEDIKSTNSYLTFKLGDEYFAVLTSNVLNILEMTPITKVPKSHDKIVGVINLRGNVLSVVDIRQYFEITKFEYTKYTCILVLNVTIDNENVEVGAIVDSVDSVLEIETNKILDPPSVGVKYKSEFITSVIKNDDHFIMILDIDKMYELENFSEQEKEELSS